MKVKLNIALFLMLLMSGSLFAQTAADVIEKGERIKKTERIFLEIDESDTSFKYVLANHLGRDGKGNYPIFVPLDNDAIFLSSRSTIEVYLKPYNPLHFSHSLDYSTINDPIDSTASANIKVVYDLLKSVTKVSAAGFLAPSPCESRRQAIGRDISKLFHLTKTSKKNEIAALYKELEKLKFQSESKTISDVSIISGKIDVLEKHFKKVDSLMNTIDLHMDTLWSDCKDTLIIENNLIRMLIGDFKNAAASETARFENLKNALGVVVKMKDDAVNHSTNSGIKWCIQVASKTLEEKKISQFKIAIKNGGSEISGNQEIVSTQDKVFYSCLFKVRKFRRFVPEFSLGSAYTLLKYNDYGLEVDSLGTHRIATPNEKMLNRLSVTTMLNYTYWIANSNLHPIWQIGGGYTAGMPSVFTGLGVRLNTNRLDRLAFSVGCAFTWKKELDSLSVGEIVDSQSKIDDDLKFEDAPTPSLYFGIQYNF